MFSSDDIQTIRKRYREFVSSESFDRYLREMHPSRRFCLLAIAFGMLTLKPIRALRAWPAVSRRRFRTHRLRRRYEHLAETSIPIVTYAAIFNRALSRSQPDGAYPAMLVGSFEQELSESEIESYAAMAATCDALPESPAEEELAGMPAGQEFRFARRRRFPTSLTNGKAVYAFDALIRGEHMSASMTDAPRVVSLAYKDERGMIVALPLAVLDRRTPPVVTQGVH